MEDKTYAWLLTEASINKIPLKILETGICRGSKVLDWYFNDNSGVVCRRLVKEGFRVKDLLDYFLNQRVPILEEYNPEKVICYLYHRKGVKIVNAKDAIELAENQLHGLQVRSVHLALSGAANYCNGYRMTAWNIQGELGSVLTYGKLGKDAQEEVKDPVICERALSLTLFVSDLVYRHCSKYIKTIKIDLICDNSGQMYVIRINELILSQEYLKSESILRRPVKHGTVKLQNSESEEERSEEVEVLNLFYEKEHRKREGLRLPLRKPAAQNSAMFLEMIAKTFDRERKAQDMVDALKSKRKELENDRDQLLRLRAFKISKEFNGKKQVFNNINDLLLYVETTRPRVWVKDNHADTSNSINIPMTSPLSDRPFFHENSDIKPLKSISKIHTSSAVGSFRKQHKQRFTNFLIEEETRLKSKQYTNKIRMVATPGYTERILSPKSATSNLTLTTRSFNQQ